VCLSLDPATPLVPGVVYTLGFNGIQDLCGHAGTGRSGSRVRRSRRPDHHRLDLALPGRRKRSGTAWSASGFNDSSWLSGVAKLGFGGDSETTVIGDGTNGYVTFYFRKTFNVSPASAFQSLIARMIVDDGVVVYLNGTEVLRYNVPAGSIDYLTEASAPVEGSAETSFVTNIFNASLLLNGINVLAAEVHQHDTNSTDLGWEFELAGSSTPLPPPVIACPIDVVVQSPAPMPGRSPGWRRRPTLAAPA